MNIRFLIDRVVKENAALLAELATSGGVRTPLVELADQLFIHLTRELDHRGVSRKVSADMFGMAQRPFLKKIQRLAESSTEKGNSLWLAVLEYISKSDQRTRVEIFQKFCRDDEAQLRAVLFDLVETQMIKREGNGIATTYTPGSLADEKLRSSSQFSELLWLLIYRDGPLTRSDIIQRSHRSTEELDDLLRSLVVQGRVTRQEVEGESVYESRDFVREVGQNSGWEAAILDHYHAMVRTMRHVLPTLTGTTSHRHHEPPQGGFTYTFDIWQDHPFANEVRAILGENRQRLSELREKVDLYNSSVERPAEVEEVVMYGGQCGSRRTDGLKDLEGCDLNGPVSSQRRQISVRSKTVRANSDVQNDEIEISSPRISSS